MTVVMLLANYLAFQKRFQFEGSIKRFFPDFPENSEYDEHCSFFAFATSLINGFRFDFSYF